ncbi:MAG: hypothetical protein FJX52_11795, partial [Alphaproteobacteria bacterium]|nr:hypothetical protein [Alphaproteobacteria bacterium]
ALAALLAVFGLIVAWRGVGPAVAMSHWAESAHVVKLLGGCAAATFVLEDLGYRLTVFLLVAFYFGWLERRHPIAAIIFALGLSLGTFALFAEALRVPLPRGPWGF